MLHEDPQFTIQVRSGEDEVIFSDDDIYHIFDSPLFEEMKQPGGLKGIPTLICWDEVHHQDKTETLVPETTGMLLGNPPLGSISNDKHYQDTL